MGHGSPTSPPVNNLNDLPGGSTGRYPGFAPQPSTVDMLLPETMLFRAAHGSPGVRFPEAKTLRQWGELPLPASSKGKT